MHFHAQESESKVVNRFLNFVLCSILACRYFKKYFRLNQIRISQPSCTGWLVAERESKVDGWSVGRIDGRTDERLLGPTVRRWPGGSITATAFTLSAAPPRHCHGPPLYCCCYFCRRPSPFSLLVRVSVHTLSTRSIISTSTHSH